MNKINISLSTLERFKFFKPKSNIIIYNKFENFDSLHRTFLLFDIPITIGKGEEIPEKFNIKIGDEVDTKDLKSIIDLLEPFGLEEIVYLDELESNTIHVGDDSGCYQEVFSIKEALNILENMSLSDFLKNMWKEQERENEFRQQQHKDSYYDSMNDEFYRQAFE
ncbi:hypothetical protein LB456_09010 [Psychroflexus sp. CAK57W]|uniref:hypothetical protein n=1 Tax=Psychroflexus curvus TaxID=2873595 RepID=UPI001CCBBFDF|nr:hypothetical protein [Psychroflexus curvus]MBZ9787593.1 hypothetical protein [Psychroflexus curvus]